MRRGDIFVTIFLILSIDTFCQTEKTNLKMKNIILEYLQGEKLYLALYNLHLPFHLMVK